ncbi:MAG: hypothetical protein WA054_01695 [Candidatus Moraniibacteriota bacterium]
MWVIERLGKFYRMRGTGFFIGCFIFNIDKVKQIVPLYKQQINLWSDPSDTNNMVDFKDGSCPVRAQVWYKPRAKDTSGTNDILDRSIYAITYSYSSLPLWIEEHLDALLRSPLQALTIEEAGLQKGTIAKKAATIFGNGLGDESGIELEQPDGVLITDIVLSDSQKKEREKKLEGKKDAEMATLRARGYIDPVTMIMAEAKSKGSEITFDQAMDLFNQQRAFETIAATGSNMTFVAPDLQGVMKTMDVTAKNKPSDDKQGGKDPRRRQGANK